MNVHIIKIVIPRKINIFSAQFNIENQWCFRWRIQIDFLSGIKVTSVWDWGKFQHMIQRSYLVPTIECVSPINLVEYFNTFHDLSDSCVENQGYYMLK
jgi:hypothetical protein